MSPIIIGQSIFKKVAVSERKMLLREISHDKVQLTVKGAPPQETFQLLAFTTVNDEFLECRHTTSSKGVTQVQKVTVNFLFRTESYFFQSELSFVRGNPVLSINVELFQLQRRASARIQIPKEIEGVFSITHHNGESLFLESKVIDISAGGIKIEIPKDCVEFVINDKIKGLLRIGHRRPLDLQAQVRFYRKVRRNMQDVHMVGLQFVNMPHMMEHRLLSLLTDMQREIYLKYAGK